jgi:hypothetical protein
LAAGIAEDYMRQETRSDSRLGCPAKQSEPNGETIAVPIWAIDAFQLYVFSSLGSTTRYAFGSTPLGFAFASSRGGCRYVSYVL